MVSGQQIAGMALPDMVTIQFSEVKSWGFLMRRRAKLGT